MSEQEIRQAAIDALSRFSVATFLYKFTVTRHRADFGAVHAKNIQDCEWFLVYEIHDGKLEWTSVDVAGFGEVCA